MSSPPRSPTISVMTLGVGSFAYSVTQILKDAGASVGTYLTRDYGHQPPAMAGPTFSRESYPSPVPLILAGGTQLVIPQSIDWALQPWAKELVASGVGILSPTGEGMRLERERSFARDLCRLHGIPFPQSFVAPGLSDALATVDRLGLPFVIKNPLCSPTSPVHTILCDSAAATREWLKHVDFTEGVFLQEYVGRAEVGHIALVSGGEIYSCVTNQEYKRAFDGNQGIVAGAPLGGLVERDPEDKYGLARELLHPLLPWFRKVAYHGPVQVTAARHGGRWTVLEYNIRLGVTSGAMMLRQLENPLEVLLGTAGNRPLAPVFRPERMFGCSVTLAGYGYPYTQVVGPPMPVDLLSPMETADCDLWWNEAGVSPAGRFLALGHRICDVIGFGKSLEDALSVTYRNIRRLRSPGSYFRTDVGRSLWPPGHE
ncbi:MAG: phosphoribosylamine--glycine ligase [Opitutae bacterium]|nr:phosphoribosylamine--glycine ligase [Opitutae bacterium]